MNIWGTASNYANGAAILCDWIGSGGNVVDRDVAQARADVCLKCPLHTAKWSFVESVAGAIKQQIGLKKHLKLRVDGEKKLHVCSVCGCAMRLKIWLPMERIKPDGDEKSKYDPNCWLLK